MKGIILTYKKDLSPRDITDLNNDIFGKVIKSRQSGRFSYYYYPGILHDHKYLKLANGCYFVLGKIAIPKTKNVVKINATLTISEKDLITAKEYFATKFEGRKVINLD